MDNKPYEYFGFKYTPKWVYETDSIGVVNSFHMGCIVGIGKMASWSAREQMNEINIVLVEHEIVRHMIQKRAGFDSSAEEANNDTR